MELAYPHRIGRPRPAAAPYEQSGGKVARQAKPTGDPTGTSRADGGNLGLASLSGDTALRFEAVLPGYRAQSGAANAIRSMQEQSQGQSHG